MSGKRSARAWLRRHVSDTYVKEANARGLRSRAALKLEQIDDAERLLRGGLAVLDLGAAPGGWSQVAAERVGRKGCVVAVDLLAMAPIPGVRVVEGDFRDPAVREELVSLLPGGRADLVISDVAPNLTGVKVADQAAAAELVREGLELASDLMGDDGAVLFKIFHGASMEEVMRAARSRFRSIKTRKPPASRSRSTETYLVGRGIIRG